MWYFSSQEINPNISGKDSTASVTSTTSEDTSSSCSSVEGDLDVTSSASEKDYCKDQSHLYRYAQGVSVNNIYGLDMKSAPEDIDVYQR